jgi:hypothetical protein
MDTERLADCINDVKHSVRVCIEKSYHSWDTDLSDYKSKFDGARQELVEMEVPDYDEKNPDQLTLYFFLASVLYLVYDLFSLKSSQFQSERDDLACRVRKSLERIPLHKRNISFDFEHHHEDTWLDERLWPFKTFIDTGKVPRMGLSGFLWLFLKYCRYSLPVSFENYDTVGDNCFDSLATYCAYARNEEKLMENVNNYALILFANIKGRSLSFERGLRKLRYIVYCMIGTGQEKTNLLTTIKDNEEFINLVRFHNFVKASSEEYDPLCNSLLNLVKKAFDCEDDYGMGDESKQEILLESVEEILNQKIALLKKWPFLTMFCYMMIHYLEEEELLQLFKKPVGEGNGALAFKDIRECPELQCLFFFTLFDMSYGARVKGRYEIGDEFLAALKRGDWFEPAVQSRLFMGILKQNDMKCPITADEMTFKKYIDKRFFATQSVLNLMYNVACYSESKTILNITQQINNIGEHRSVFVYPKVQAVFANEPDKKSENWVKPYTKFYTDYTADEQKKMKAESDKMKKIDCGILLPDYLQQIPGCSDQFFSRNFEMKLFLQTDVSCVPGPEGILQKRDYHLQRNRRMLECGYLHYARNMKTHNVDLNYTGSLLNPKHYPDLLRILYSVMRQMQKDCSQPDSEKRLFKLKKSNSLDDDSIWDSLWISTEKCLLEAAIEKGEEMELLDYLKSCESMIEQSVLDKDTDKSAVELFQDLANLHKRLVGKFSSNVDAAAMKVSDAAREKLLAMQESYDAVSYDLFKDEPNYDSPFLKKCISLLLQVIQCVTSTKGVVEQLKKESEFNVEGVQRPLLNREGDVTFEDKGDQVIYPKALVKELRVFLDTVFGMEYLRKSIIDRVNRNVFHLYGYKIMLYLMKVTLQMTRMDVKAIRAGRN